MHLFLFTNSAQREPWFQFVRREYATAINFPCISTLYNILKIILKAIEHRCFEFLIYKLMNFLELLILVHIINTREPTTSSSRTRHVIYCYIMYICLHLFILGQYMYCHQESSKSCIFYLKRKILNFHCNWYCSMVLK